MKNKSKRLTAIFLSLCISAAAAAAAVAMPVSAAEATGETAPETAVIESAEEPKVFSTASEETVEKTEGDSSAIEDVPAPVDLTTGWQTVNGKTYYFGSDGKKVTGWQRIDKLYYFDKDGVMATNWQTIGGKTYYFGSDGVLRKGMKEIDGKKYYFETSDGSLSTRRDFITTSSGNTYYLQGDGTVATGIKTINGKTYYFAASGVMQKSKWVTVSGKRYYLKGDGKAATGWTKLSGYRYWFSDKGVLDEDVRDRSDVKGISHVVVSLKECSVTVIGYGADGVGDIPMVKFVCSPGLPETPTPTGTYYSNKYGRWVPLMGPSWGQYGIHVVQGIFFHSVACTYQNVHNVPAYAYSQLGKPASHGCIRLLVGDVKWLYDHIGSNTRTVITNSTSRSVISYFLKPSVPPLRTTNGMNWDPTDPVAKEMFDKTVVANVSGVKSESSTTSSVKLSWKTVSGASGYDVYRKDDGKWGKIGHTTSLSYTDKDLKAGTKYEYGIQAYKLVDGKAYYSSNYGTVTTATNPAKLSGLTVNTTTDSATLKWKAVDGVTGYYVYYRLAGTSQWTRASTTKLTYTFSGLEQNTKYEFAAKGYKTVDSKTYNGAYPTVTAKTQPEAVKIDTAVIAPIETQLYTGNVVEPPLTIKDGTKTLTEGTDYTLTYKDNIEAGTATVTVTGKGGYTGTVTTTFEIKEESIQVGEHVYSSSLDGVCNHCGVNRETVETRQVTHMFRMYNSNTGEHFYTGSETEKEDLIAEGWNYEGVGFTSPSNTGAPVYRLYEPSTGEHLYTMNENEKDRLTAKGWNYEGIAFNSAYNTEAAQYRLYNPNATCGAYHFTFSEDERQDLLDAGWVDQGIGWYSCWQ